MKEGKFIITLESNTENPTGDFRHMCDMFRKMESYGGGVCRVKSIKPYKE